MHEGVRGQRHGGEKRRAEQGPAHFLEHHREFDVAVTGATVLLGDDQPLQTHLLAHLGPHPGVEAIGGVHEATHLGLRRLVVEELANNLAQFFLLF